MYDLQNDVDQLERLVKSKTDQVEPLIAVLDSLATALRNGMPPFDRKCVHADVAETLRIPASSTQLPLLLTTLLNLKAGLRAPEVVLQAGRVAANLAAECGKSPSSFTLIMSDEARTALAQAEYPQSAVKALKHFGTIKSLVISLLNLAVDRHGTPYSRSKLKARGCRGLLERLGVSRAFDTPCFDYGRGRYTRVALDYSRRRGHRR